MSLVSSHSCVGVVLQSARGMLQGEPVWTCKLLLSQWGREAGSDRCTAAQELLGVRCKGYAVSEYCLANIENGALVHVVSKLVHRHRYVPLHSAYISDTELLVTDNFGSILKVGTPSLRPPTR